VFQSSVPSIIAPVQAQSSVLQTYEVTVRGVVVACANNGAGGCDARFGWGITVKEVVQPSSSCPALTSSDTAWVQVDHADIIGDVELMSNVEAYGACEPQPQNTKWPYLIYLDYPPHYIKVITGPGPGPATYQVNLFSGVQGSPDDIGATITFDGASHKTPSSVSVTPNTWHTIAVLPYTMPYVFVNWEISGPSQIKDPYAQTTQVYIDHPGYIKGWYKIKPILPDLTAKSCWLKPENPNEGDSVTFYATIGNIGSSAANNIPVKVYLDDKPYDSKTSSFPPGSSYDFDTSNKPWTATSGPHTVRWVANPEPRSVQESNYTNNEVTCTFSVGTQPPKKIQLVGLDTTIKQTEFQGEETFVWVYIANLGTTQIDVTVKASTQSQGWTVPNSLVTIGLSSNRDSSVPAVGFQVYFDSGAESGQLSVCIVDTGDCKSISLTIYPSSVKTIAIGVARALNEIQLRDLDGKMNPTTAVTQFAQSIIQEHGLSTAPDEDKAYALYQYVIQHATYSCCSEPKSIGDIVQLMNQNGGVATNYRIVGDCKTYAVFFGGLAGSLGIIVRPVSGSMEASSALGLRLIGHAWTEIDVNGNWVFVDPTNQFFGDRDTLHSRIDIDIRPWVLPDNLQTISFEAQKSYDYVADWGGPLVAETYYQNTIADLTSNYRIDSKQTSTEGTVILSLSPVRLTVYDSGGNKLAESEPFVITYPGSKNAQSANPDQEQYVVLQIPSAEGLVLRLNTIGLGSFTIAVVQLSGTGSSVTSIQDNATSIGQTADYEVRASGGGGLEITKRQNQFPEAAVYAPIIAIAAIALLFVSFIRRRRPRIISVLPPPMIKSLSQKPLIS